MIRTSDGPVNLARVRLRRTAYKSPVDVATGFEQMAQGVVGTRELGMAFVDSVTTSSFI